MEIIYEPKETGKNKRNMTNLKVVFLGETLVGKSTFFPEYHLIIF